MKRAKGTAGGRDTREGGTQTQVSVESQPDMPRAVWPGSHVCTAGSESGSSGRLRELHSHVQRSEERGREGGACFPPCDRLCFPSPPLPVHACSFSAPARFVRGIVRSQRGQAPSLRPESPSHAPPEAGDDPSAASPAHGQPPWVHELGIAPPLPRVAHACRPLRGERRLRHQNKGIRGSDFIGEPRTLPEAEQRDAGHLGQSRSATPGSRGAEAGARWMPPRPFSPALGDPRLGHRA